MALKKYIKFESKHYIWFNFIKFEYELLVYCDRFSGRIVSIESEIERVSQWSTADRVGEEWMLEYRHGNNRLITGHYLGGQSGSESFQEGDFPSRTRCAASLSPTLA